MSEKRPPEPPGLMEKLAERLGLSKNRAGLIKLLAVGLFLGILFMSAGDLFGLETGTGGSDHPPNATLVSAPATGPEDELTRQERRIAGDLEEKLSLIQGAGQVRVMVTLAAGPTIEVVRNTTVDQSTMTEKASDNSTRETQTTNSRMDHVFSRDGSVERPVVARTSGPEVAGVLVVAEGARDARIKARLLDAAMVALKVPAHRIEVVPAKGGE